MRVLKQADTFAVHIGRAHLMLIEQCLRVRVAIEIDVVERMAVACQKFPHPQCAGVMHRAHHDDIPKATSNQLEAAENLTADKDEEFA